MRLPEEKIYEMLPTGTHLAVCNRIVDLGTQDTAFGSKHQILLGWETAEEKMSDGRPFAISRRYVLSTDRRSNFRAALEAMLQRSLTPEDFGKLDLETLLGLAALLHVRHDVREARTFVNVANVMPPPKGTPPRASDGICFSFEPFDRNAFEALPVWVQDLIRRSPEYLAATRADAGTGSIGKRLHAALKSADLPSDGIPF
jgi:hypothetical protein